MIESLRPNNACCDEDEKEEDFVYHSNPDELIQ